MIGVWHILTVIVSPALSPISSRVGLMGVNNVGTCAKSYALQKSVTGCPTIVAFGTFVGLLGLLAQLLLRLEWLLLWDV